jgi:hypothetical protein
MTSKDARGRTPMPKAVLDTLAALQTERAPLAARLDAIDLAMDNLRRVYAAPAVTEAKPHGGRRKALISRSSSGVTVRELRQGLPHIQGKARSNALSKLKAAGLIRRTGRIWLAAAS